MFAPDFRVIILLKAVGQINLNLKIKLKTGGSHARKYFHF